VRGYNVVIAWDGVVAGGNIISRNTIKGSKAVALRRGAVVIALQ